MMHGCYAPDGDANVAAELLVVEAQELYGAGATGATGAFGG
jgi:hypothetical protein